MKLYKYIFTLILVQLFSTSYAQIDYPSLIRNLEEVTFDTNFKTYFKGLSYEVGDYGENSFKDERFLRYHGVIIDDVVFDRSSWRNSLRLDIKLFNEEEDYNFLLKKLTALYKDPEIDETETRKRYTWRIPGKEITMKINLENNKFASFDEFTIYLGQS